MVNEEVMVGAYCDVQTYNIGWCCGVLEDDIASLAELELIRGLTGCFRWM